MKIIDFHMNMMWIIKINYLMKQSKEIFTYFFYKFKNFHPIFFNSPGVNILWYVF